ncbi:MAG TPA: efflux transporter periplasmic adaptor subunit, partial [Lentimicrobium sp.]|nr:efflux transporter periplasmic adaptor subunit [Lentimicrobium sp.]
AGTFQADLLFTGEEPLNVKRGQTLQVKLKFSGSADALIVRRGGFFQETGGNWVYVVDPDEKIAVKRNISLGRQNSMHYEVLSGLEEGEKVIVSSYSSFNSRDKLIFRK